MQLVGRLSRPSSRLRAVLDLPAGSGKWCRLAVPERSVGRLGNGAVLRAVIGVFAGAGSPMPIAAIHGAVERLLGRAISRESVSRCLRMGVKGEGGDLSVWRVVLPALRSILILCARQPDNRTCSWCGIASPSCIAPLR